MRPINNRPIAVSMHKFTIEVETRKAIVVNEQGKNIMACPIP